MIEERPDSTEAALELFLARRARGEALDPAEFVARHAELGPELRQAIEAWIALESATSGAELAHVPERVGPYRVLREIGRGGMGVVLEAVEEPLGRRVALKVLPAELLASTAARARFAREAALAARLDSSGIATVYGAGVEGEHPWIAMRFVEGLTLARAIVEAREAGARCVELERGGSRAPELALAACIARVARALQTAHEQGVVHRDVKPSNVIVAPGGEPVLVDFGLAIAADEDGPTLTRTGETAGTPAYLAPETVSGERARHDAQTDVYALGVTLYECLALRRPFEAPTRAALYRAILTGAAPKLRSANPRVPRDLAVVVATALERDRDRRYRSAADLGADLEAAAEGRPIAARPVPIAGRALRWVRREPRMAGLGALLAVALLALATLGGAWWSSRAEVRAASTVNRERAYDDALQRGFGDVAVNWLEEADEQFEAALAIVPDSVEAIAGLALVRMRSGRDAEAAALLDRAPEMPAVVALRAIAEGGDPPVVLGPDWYAQASSIELFLDGTRLSRQARGKQGEARARLLALAEERFVEAVQRSWTSRILYHVQWAIAARDAGDEAGCRAAAAALTTLWSVSGRACFTAALALYRYDPEAAQHWFERACELEPGWGAPHQNLGNLHLARHDYSRAEAEERRAIELDPRDADAFNTLGLALQRLDREAEAVDAFHGALALRPMFETWANLGLLEQALGHHVEAERALREALRFVPDQDELLRGLARSLHAQGRLDEAIEAMEHAARAGPDALGAWRDLAGWNLDAGRPGAALAAAEEGLRRASPASDDFAELESLREDAAREAGGR